MDILANDILKKSFWDAATYDVSRTGDINPDAVYQAVGIALTAWESVEEALQSLFLKLCKANDAGSFNLLSKLFGAVESSGTRRNLLKVAAGSYFENYRHIGELFAEYNKIHNALSWAAARRDELAHGVVKGVRTHSSEGHQDSGFFLIASAYNHRTNDFYAQIEEDDVLGLPFSRSRYRYTSSEIIELQQKFGNLLRFIFEYMGHISSGDGTAIPANALHYLKKAQNQKV
jgi:hypothetical protein